jgi:hypothetical protein
LTPPLTDKELTLIYLAMDRSPFSSESRFHHLYRFGYVTHDINLDYKVVHLAYNQEKIKKAISKYGSKIKMLDPGYLGAVLLTSETDEFTIEDIIEEYKIELLDEYFDRALAFQAAHVEK